MTKKVSSRIVAVVSLALGAASLVCPGCGPHKSVERLAAEASREYEILVPSLQSAIAELLAEVRPLGLRYKGKPCVYCSREQWSSSEDGERTVYHFNAVEIVVEYDLIRIREIRRAGTPKHPFHAEVDFSLSVLQRSFAFKHETPGHTDPHVNILPDGEEPSPLPLPVPPTPGRLADDTPRKLSAVVERVIKDCLAEEPTKNTMAATVTFAYSAAGKKWIWLATSKGQK